MYREINPDYSNSEHIIAAGERSSRKGRFENSPALQCCGWNLDISKNLAVRFRPIFAHSESKWTFREDQTPTVDEAFVCHCGTRIVMATPRLRWACPSGAKDSPLAQNSPKKSASAGLVPAGPRFPVKREALVAENARPVSPAIRGECQTIVINLGSTGTRPVEAGDF